ncbi:MAG: hypothetical protein MHM6MM_005451 [Cercozoa sp. M6MM]
MRVVSVVLCAFCAVKYAWGHPKEKQGSDASALKSLLETNDEIEHEQQDLGQRVSKASSRLKNKMGLLWSRLDHIDHVLEHRHTPPPATTSPQPTTTDAGCTVCTCVCEAPPPVTTTTAAMTPASTTTSMTPTSTTTTSMTTTSVTTTSMATTTATPCTCPRETVDSGDACPVTPGTNMGRDTACTCDFECATPLLCSDECQREATTLVLSHVCVVSADTLAAGDVCSCDSECDSSSFLMCSSACTFDNGEQAAPNPHVCVMADDSAIIADECRCDSECFGALECTSDCTRDNGDTEVVPSHICAASANGLTAGQTCLCDSECGSTAGVGQLMCATDCTVDGAVIAGPVCAQLDAALISGDSCNCDFECARGSCTDTCQVTREDGGTTAIAGNLCVTEDLHAGDECFCNLECLAGLSCIQPDLILLTQKCGLLRGEVCDVNDDACFDHCSNGCMVTDDSNGNVVPLAGDEDVCVLVDASVGFGESCRCNSECEPPYQCFGPGNAVGTARTCALPLGADCTTGSAECFAGAVCVDPCMINGGTSVDDMCGLPGVLADGTECRCDSECSGSSSCVSGVCNADAVLGGVCNNPDRFCLTGTYSTNCTRDGGATDLASEFCVFDDNTVILDMSCSCDSECDSGDGLVCSDLCKRENAAVAAANICTNSLSSLGHGFVCRCDFECFIGMHLMQGFCSETCSVTTEAGASLPSMESGAPAPHRCIDIPLEFNDECFCDVECSSVPGLFCIDPDDPTLDNVCALPHGTTCDPLNDQCFGTCASGCTRTIAGGIMFSLGDICITAVGSVDDGDECQCDSECMPGLVCLDGPPTCGKLSFGDICDANNDACDTGLSCVRGLCTPDGLLGGACLGGTFCTDGSICETARSPPICVLPVGLSPGACTTRFHCPDGTLCDLSNSNCVQPTGGTAVLDAPCGAEEHPAIGSGGVECTDTTHACANSGLSATPVDPLGALKCLLQDGQVCAAHTDCASGACDIGGTLTCLVTPYSQELRRQTTSILDDDCDVAPPTCASGSCTLGVCDFAAANSPCFSDGFFLECSMLDFILSTNLASAACGAVTSMECPCPCTRESQPVLIPVCPLDDTLPLGTTCGCDNQCAAFCSDNCTTTGGPTPVGSVCVAAAGTVAMGGSCSCDSECVSGAGPAWAEPSVLNIK